MQCCLFNVERATVMTVLKHGGEDDADALIGAVGKEEDLAGQTDRLGQCRGRELRSGRGGGGVHGWSHPETYRIRGALTPPSADNIRRWCEACGVADQAADIVAQSHSAESEWRRNVRLTELAQVRRHHTVIRKIR